MVMDFGQKVIDVTCPDCGWQESWTIANGRTSRNIICTPDNDGGFCHEAVDSAETNIFGMPRIPKRCPACGEKTKRYRVPVVF